MTNAKPNFQAELGTIKSDLDIDVEAILALSKRSTMSELGNETSGSAESESSNVSKAEPSKNRHRRQNYFELRNKSSNQNLENVTTRLTSGINDLLTEAALRQKLAKRSPSTRQAIIEEALREWLIQSGYLNSKHS